MVDAIRTTGASTERAVARVLAAQATVPTPASTTPPQAPGADLARLSGLRAELAARPPVNEERVAQIKRAIASGTFPILPATIADRLMASRYEWMSDEQA